MRSTESQDKSSICIPHYAWFDFGGVISANFLHTTSCLALVLEGALLHLGQIPTARSTQLPLSIVERPTNLRPPQTSFHMTSFFRRPNFRRYCDVSNVARETFQTSQDRRFKRGNCDVSNVARPTFQTWQLRRGNCDVSNVARPTFQTWQLRRFKRGNCDVSNVAIATFQTWQLRIATFQTWQERRFKRGKTDV
jgi:hypothetical protein